MPYTTNPSLPKLRAKAIKLMRQNNWSIRKTAKYFGFNPSTILRWNRKVPLGGSHEIPTNSSRPKHHSKQLNKEIIKKIIDLRIATKGRCSEVIHQELVNQGVIVSLNSVKRTLDRNCLLRKRSPWQRYHQNIERPKVANLGDLVEIDTIHLMKTPKEKIYVYTLLDVNSRWAFAWASARINAQRSINFVKQAKEASPFNFSCLQSDNGSEFSQHFTERVKTTHRHSRVRQPNDNAHLERFNRTIQHECLNYLPKDVKLINRELPKYLEYYNQDRLHLGLGLKTPNQIIAKCCQAIG